ncbi:MAG: hypothetical protein JJU33_13070 [Phycisphaerales bacterium]|nr:hypothetical protein [Phycisphaerales bacterium]
MTRLAISRIAAAAALGAALALGACAPVQIPFAPVADWRVPVEGQRIEAGEPLNADIRNPQGSIRVVVKPELTRPEVFARPWYPPGTGKANPRYADFAIRTQALIEAREDGRKTLVVQVSPTEDPDLRINLIVHTPSLETALIRNAYGPVELVGVGDAVNVHSGLADRGPASGGDIRVRTERAIRGPVKFMTTGGDIYLYAGGDSAGRLEALAENGTVRVSSRKRAVSGVFAQPHRFRGVVNEGANVFDLETARGNITVRFADGPWELAREFDWSGDKGR